MRIPNVFVQESCSGSHHTAERMWTRPLAALNGASPAEAWDDPARVMSAQDLATNPKPDRLTTATVRSRIIRIVRAECGAMRTTDTFADRTPDYSDLLVDENAPKPETAAVLPFGMRLPPPGNGRDAAFQKMLEDVRRRGSRH